MSFVVLEDLQKITKIHFETLQTLVLDSQLPIYNLHLAHEKQMQQQQQQKQHHVRQQQAYGSTVTQYGSPKREYPHGYRTALF